MSRRVGSPKALVTAATMAENWSPERGTASTPVILPTPIVEIPGSRHVPVTPEQVIEALRPVQDPELGRSIVDLDMVRDVRIDGGRVGVVVALTVAGCPLRA